MWRGKQMMVPRGWCTSQPPWRIRPFRVHRPNRKAECAETCPLRLERGKGCKALPIATWVGAIPPGYPADLSGDRAVIDAGLANSIRNLTVWGARDPVVGGANRPSAEIRLLLTNQ